MNASLMIVLHMIPIVTHLCGIIKRAGSNIAFQISFEGGPMKIIKRIFPRVLFAIHHMKTKGDILFCRIQKIWFKVSLSLAAVLSMSMPAFAATQTGTTDIWSWLDKALTDLYNKFLSVSTIAACVAASVCLIMMNFSTDDRAVSTSRAWLKRILISWVILSVLGYIMAYLVTLTSGGSYVP